jgi:hypothetical protein
LTVAFTYNLDTDAGQLRFIIGDTTELGQCVLTDEEVDFLLTRYGSVNAAVIPAVDARIAKASTAVDYQSGAEEEKRAALMAQLRTLRRDLVAQGYPVPEVSPTTGTRPRVSWLTAGQQEAGW